MLKAEDVRKEEDEEEESDIGEVDMDMDIGEDGSMSCRKHPNYNVNNNNPGGICAICLQEKLGNLVSSSNAFPPSSSTTASRSESTRTFGHSLSTNNAQRKPRIPFLTSFNKNANATSLQRSKSTAATSSFSDGQRRSFWSFLGRGLSSANSSSSSNRVGVGVSSGTTPSVTTRASSVRQVTIAIAEDEEDEENSQRPGPASRRSHTHRPPMAADKVSRSRSVGCGGGGSRSFSGDFFERLGDCTIRRVESQWQSNVSAASVAVLDQQQQQHKGINERVRCGGIFGGFNLTSSEEAANSGTTGRMNSSSSSSMGTGGVDTQHVRNRSWAWTLASPLRAFGKPTTSTPSSSSSGNNNKSLHPSLLSVSGG